MPEKISRKEIAVYINENIGRYPIQIRRKILNILIRSEISVIEKGDGCQIRTKLINNKIMAKIYDILLDYDKSNKDRITELFGVMS